MQMRALDFWKVVAVDTSGFIEKLTAWLVAEHIRYCVIGGQAVNAYAEPLVSLDLDLAVAADQMEALESLGREGFHVERFPHSLNVSLAGSDLRVQFQTDPRYSAFVEGAEPRDVLGLRMPVASLENVLTGKVWAVQDPGRRPSKRQKDLADIARLIETHPHLRDLVPREVLSRLL